MSHLNESKQKVIVISGPTASGKTALGLWLSQTINGEIISADSVQVCITNTSKHPMCKCYLFLNEKENNTI